MLTLMYSVLISLLIIVNSWGLGALVNHLLKKIAFYKTLSGNVLIKNDRWNKILGLGLFKFLVSKTFYAKLDPSLKIASGGYQELARVKTVMINSEIGHFIGLISSQLVFAGMYMRNNNASLLLIGTLFNILMNLYPILLQQQNQSRINSILKTYFSKV